MNSHMLQDSARLKEVLFWTVSIVIELLCVLGIVYAGSISTLLMLITIAGLAVGDAEMLSLFPLEYLVISIGCFFLFVWVFEHQREHFKKRHRQ